MGKEVRGELLRVVGDAALANLGAEGVAEGPGIAPVLGCARGVGGGVRVRTAAGAIHIGVTGIEHVPEVARGIPVLLLAGEHVAPVEAVDEHDVGVGVQAREHIGAL